MGDLSQWAAWAAAVTSMATLVVTTVVGGRREQRKWARDALTDAFVGFLEASWAHSDTVRALPDDQVNHSARTQEYYAEMRSQLTRLRLLASPQVLEAGKELLRCQRAVQDAPPGVRREQALVDAARSRRLVVEAAKREMGL
ncbi:hypothetical protein ACH4UM_13710 [Streptomyces sp. NPDC020801]|uniref:hypothetical protein n=1 Tax=unclassified Streptomyces TaxID=2593676 RepID=UPI0037BAC22B